MKKNLLLLGLMLSTTTTSFANYSDAEFAERLKRALGAAEVVLACGTESIYASSQRCNVALDEAVSLGVTSDDIAGAIEAIAQAKQNRKESEEDNQFNQRFKGAMGKASIELMAKRQELLKPLLHYKLK